MKIRRIKVLLAKGWYVAVWCVSYSLFSMFCSFASAKRQDVTTTAVQDSIKAGDIISGKVSDGGGPMMMVNITERDSKNRIVAHSITDMEGNFSFRLVNPADRLQVTYVGYTTVDTLINSTYYDIKIEPTIYWDEFEELALMTDVQDNPQVYGPSAGLDIVFNSGNLIARPLLVLDNNIITADSAAWAGIDLTRADYSKEELARLFGVKARKIKSVSYLKRQAAMALWGAHGFNGAIEVQTKKGRK